MKILRVLLSLSIGFAASHFLAVTFFNYADYTTDTDRLFLTVVPALAIGILLFEIFPAISAWTVRIRTRFSFLYYLLGFLMSFKLTYGAVGFLNEVLRTPFGMVVFTSVSITLGSVAGYYLFRCAAHSLRGGFLSRPLNMILVLSLPLLVSAVMYGSVQFPAMFLWEYITVPQKWMALFGITVLAGGVWSLSILEGFELRGYYEKLKQTKLFMFISQNLPGLYASGMFLLVHIILARALNHPALSYNSVLFEADAGPWMKILASPEGGMVGRAVHPLSLIIIRPLIRLVSGMMSEHYAIGGMLVTSAIAGLCVFMVWLFVKRATESKTYAFLFAILLGSTATHLLFGSLTENYIFGAASLIFFFLLIQAGEKRFAVLVPAGLLLFGITITNIAQGLIGLFFNKFGIRRLLQYGVTVLAFGILLAVFTNSLYPNKQGLFFVPADIVFEMNFVSSDRGSLSDPMRLSEPSSVTRKFQVVTRSMLLYGVIGTKPLEVISEKPPFSTIDMKTFDVRTGRLAPYKGLAKLPSGLWLVLLTGGFLMFVKNFRASKHTPLMLGLLGALGFNFLMHLFYGTELFLYTSYWVYALALFVALALSEFADKTWFQWGLALAVLVLMSNNFWFIFTVLRGLAPFYAVTP